MKNIYTLFKSIAFCTVLVVTMGGCDLDVAPPSDIAAETFWTNDKDAWTNLNAIYRSTMPGIGIYNDTFCEDVYCQYTWESAGSIFVTDGYSSANDAGWNFESVRKANLFLREVDNCVMNDDVKARFKAEVRFMRAFSYFGLTITFGKVPLITEVLEYNAPNVPRDEVSKVREFILTELTEVAKMLPASYSGGYLNEKGRVTKYAALAVKARAALYFGDYVLAEQTAKDIMDNGGYSLFRISSLNAAQQKEADEMSLYVDFDKLGVNKDKFIKGMFSYESLWHDANANPDNPEYIMTRQFTAASIDHEDGVRYTNMRPNQMGGWSSLTPTQNLVDAYWEVDGESEPQLPTVADRAAAYKKIKADLDAFLKADEKNNTFEKFVQTKSESGELKDYAYVKEFRNRDSRMYASILMPFKGWYETDMGAEFAYQWIKGGNNESKSGFNFRKMVALSDPNDAGSAAGDFPSIRYAEVLLTFAEARVQTTGYDAQVRAALNDIRDRCGMPDVPASLSKTEAVEFIRQERRIELAGEGYRGDDITRYESAYWSKCLNNVPLVMPDGEVILTMKWNERMRLRPIPTVAMDMNPLLKGDQNPGY